MQHKSTVRTARPAAILAALLVSIATLPAHAQPQNDDQQKCLKAMLDAGQRVAKAQAGTTAGCIKLAPRGSLDNEHPPQGCIIEDDPGKVESARAKAITAQAASCGMPPDFGYTSATVVGGAAKSAFLDLLDAVFQRPIYTAVGVPQSDGVKCHGKVVKALGKIVKSELKTFASCALGGLDNGSITSTATLGNCWLAVEADADGKIAAAVAYTADIALSDKCAIGDFNENFRGRCGASEPAFGTCLQAAASCSACAALDSMFALGLDCDALDDGMTNASCIEDACGDGVLQPERGEQCDDGNVADGDGCDGCQFDLLSAAPCLQGQDPVLYSSWVLCDLDPDGPWISMDAGVYAGGQPYHPVLICQQLGYSNVSGYSATGGLECSFSGSPTSCASPGERTFNVTWTGEGNVDAWGYGTGIPAENADEHGPLIGNTVMWECTE